VSSAQEYPAARRAGTRRPGNAGSVHLNPVRVRTVEPVRSGEKEAKMAQPDDDSLVLDDHLEPWERDIEAPPEDAAEQATPANPADARVEPRVPFEASEADAIDQAVIVDLDDDGYR
jgi:hypothetical protein